MERVLPRLVYRIVCICFVCFAVAGCNQETQPNAAVTPINHSQASASDASTADSDATRVIGMSRFDWGPDSSQAELAIDRGTQQVTLKLWQTDGETPLMIEVDRVYLTIDAPLTEIELTPEPPAESTAGKASRFVAKHETLSLTKPLSGTLSAKIANQPYVSDFAEAYDLFASQSQTASETSAAPGRRGS